MYTLGSSLHTSSEELDACGPNAPSALELFNRINSSVGGRGWVKASGLPTRVIGAMTKVRNTSYGVGVMGRFSNYAFYHVAFLNPLSL